VLLSGRSGTRSLAKGFTGGGPGTSGKVKKSIVEPSCAICAGAEVRNPCIRGIGWKTAVEGRWPPRLREWKSRGLTKS